MQRFFTVFGLAILLLLAIAEYRGWSLTSYDEVRGVPKSVRDNPGSYRSHYTRTFHK
jgi:hypothetical protein